MALPGVHRLNPYGGGEPLCISFIAMQRLGESVWAACHKYVETELREPDGTVTMHRVHQRPSRRWIVDTGKGILQVRDAAYTCLHMPHVAVRTCCKLAAHAWCSWHDCAAAALAACSHC